MPRKPAKDYYAYIIYGGEKVDREDAIDVHTEQVMERYRGATRHLIFGAENEKRIGMVFSKNRKIIKGFSDIKSLAAFYNAYSCSYVKALVCLGKQRGPTSVQPVMPPKLDPHQ